MIKHELILKPYFDLVQKINILIFSVLYLAIIIKLLTISLNIIGIIFVLFSSIFLFAVILLTFLKVGVFKNGAGFFKGYFIINRLIFSKEVDLTNKSAIAILKFKKRQKFAFYSVAQPDLSHSFNSFDLYLLNERHTKKDLLFSLKSEKKAKNVIDFLTEHTELKYEKYNPRFYKKTNNKL